MRSESDCGPWLEIQPVFFLFAVLNQVLLIFCYAVTTPASSWNRNIGADLHTKSSISIQVSSSIVVIVQPGTTLISDLDGANTSATTLSVHLQSDLLDHLVNLNGVETRIFETRRARVYIS